MLSVVLTRKQKKPSSQQRDESNIPRYHSN